MTASPEAPAVSARKRRRPLMATIVVAALLGAVVWFLPALLSAAWMRPTVLSWMNRDPAHRVDFAALDLSWTSGMKLTDFAVYDAPDAGAAPFVSAKTVAISVQWTPLFRKRIVVDEFTVKDAVIDLSRPAPADAAARGEPSAPRELPAGAFGLDSARVPIVLRDVVVKLAKCDVKIASARLLVRVDEGVLLFDPIDADVNGGRIAGTARVGLDGASPAHALDLHAKGIVLDEFLAPLAARVFPLLAGAPKDGKTSGKADLDLALTASGRRVASLKTSLRGDGAAALSDVALESKSWLADVLKATGGGADRMRLDPVRMTFHVADGRVALDETDVKSPDLLMKIGGAVTLDGEMDCRLRLKPTAGVAAFERYARFLDPDGFVPIRLTGGVTSPKAALPGVGDVLENVLKDGELQDRAKRALDKALGGKGDEPPKK